MLKALKSGLESEVSRYEDITPIDLKGFLEQRKTKVDLRATRGRSKKNNKKNKKQNLKFHKWKKQYLLLCHLE